MGGPWRSVPTDGWTPDLTERWLILEEDIHALDRERQDLAKERHGWARDDRQRDREREEREGEERREERRQERTEHRANQKEKIEIARMKAEADLQRQERLAKP